MEPKIIEGAYRSAKNYGDFLCIGIGANELTDEFDSMNLEKKKVRITVEVIDAETIKIDLARIVHSPDAMAYLGLNPHNVYETPEEQNKTYDIEVELASMWGLL